MDINTIPVIQAIRERLATDSRDGVHRVKASFVLSARAAKGNFALTQHHRQWPSLGSDGIVYYGCWRAAIPNPFRG